MKIPFANLPRKVKGLLKGSNKGHRIRITPFATAQHHVIGTINPELTSITIDETSMAYVRVNREHLENSPNVCFLFHTSAIFESGAVQRFANLVDLENHAK